MGEWAKVQNHKDVADNRLTNSAGWIDNGNLDNGLIIIIAYLSAQQLWILSSRKVPSLNSLWISQKWMTCQELWSKWNTVLQTVFSYGVNHKAKKASIKEKLYIYIKYMKGEDRWVNKKAKSQRCCGHFFEKSSEMNWQR